MRLSNRPRGRVRLLLALALLATIGGCRAKKSVGDFTPAPGNARSALEAALNSWKRGEPQGMVDGASKPAVQAADFEWAAGMKLADYEILGEQPPTDNARTFAVRLKPAQGEPREAKYMVVGIDPMLVYRDKDYAKDLGGGD